MQLNLSEEKTQLWEYKLSDIDASSIEIPFYVFN